MVEGAISLFKLVLRLAIVIISFTLFTGLYLSTFASVMIVLQQSIINDLFALLQIWLPFNLSTVTLWIFGIVTMFIAYRMSIKAIEFMKDVTGIA